MDWSVDYAYNVSPITIKSEAAIHKTLADKEKQEKKARKTTPDKSKEKEPRKKATKRKADEDADEPPREPRRRIKKSQSQESEEEKAARDAQTKILAGVGITRRATLMDAEDIDRENARALSAFKFMLKRPAVMAIIQTLKPGQRIDFPGEHIFVAVLPPKAPGSKAHAKAFSTSLYEVDDRLNTAVSEPQRRRKPSGDSISLSVSESDSVAGPSSSTVVVPTPVEPSPVLSISNPVVVNTQPTSPEYVTVDQFNSLQYKIDLLLQTIAAGPNQPQRNITTHIVNNQTESEGNNSSESMEMRLVNEPKPVGPVATEPVTLSQPVLQTTALEVELSESSESYIIEPKEPKAPTNIESKSELKLKSRRKTRGRKLKGRKSDSPSLVRQREQERTRAELRAARNKEYDERCWLFRGSAMLGRTETDNTDLPKDLYPTAIEAVWAYRDVYSDNGVLDIKQLRADRKIHTKPRKDKKEEANLILAEMEKRFI